MVYTSFDFWCSLLLKNEAHCKLHSLFSPSRLNTRSNLLNFKPVGKIKRR